MRDFVRFGVILHYFATVAGWIFCLVLLGDPQERTLLGFVLLLVWTFWQTIRVLELLARLLLGRLDEKEEQMQQSFARLSEQLGESKAKGILAGMLVAKVGCKLVLPAAMNQI